MGGPSFSIPGGMNTVQAGRSASRRIYGGGGVLRNFLLTLPRIGIRRKILQDARSIPQRARGAFCGCSSANPVPFPPLGGDKLPRPLNNRGEERKCITRTPTLAPPLSRFLPCQSGKAMAFNLETAEEGKVQNSNRSAPPPNGRLDDSS